MCFIISLIPASFWVIVGYFVLFSASKTDSSGIRAFGQILAVWTFVIAAAIVIGAGTLLSRAFVGSGKCSA